MQCVLRAVCEARGFGANPAPCLARTQVNQNRLSLWPSCFKSQTAVHVLQVVTVQLCIFHSGFSACKILTSRVLVQHLGTGSNDPGLVSSLARYSLRLHSSSRRGCRRPQRREASAACSTPACAAFEA